ncbi:MAG: L,D-transpeptidase [Butyrivibrio sp.]|nr:L,D-transpeptidase [Butyrivibrio sp.]
MNVRAKLIGRIVLLITSALVVLYLIVGYYYSKGFPCAAKVNGVSCTGKSVAEVNSELCKTIQYGGINVKDLNGSTLFISADDIGFTVDYTDDLNKFISEQNALSWGVYVFKGLAGSVQPKVSYDKDKLDNIIANWEIFVPDETQDVSIVKTDNGYELKNTLLSTPIKENIATAVGDAALQMQEEIDLSSEQFAGCYEPATLTEEQQVIVDFYSKLQKLLNCGITYQFGNKTIPLKGDVVNGFILAYDQLSGYTYDYENPGKGRCISGSNEIEVSSDSIRDLEGFAVTLDNEPLISESRLYDFFYQMHLQCDTASMLKRYQNGEDVDIICSKDRNGSTFIFDHNAEYKHLKEAFMSGSFEQEETRNLTDPKKVDFFNAKKALGGTYIELDIANQHLYYYQNGRVYIDTAIVSGTMVGGHGTPAGLFHIYDKQRNKTLVGEDYECPVDYWMRLTETGVGIHDAWWQYEFGGTAYIDSGSHGCINCPPYIAQLLYENVKEQTPVIVYYRKEVTY